MVDPVGAEVIGVARLVAGDDVLMSGIRAGDTRAFATFHDRHRVVAAGVAMRVLNNPTLAAEATQDAFLAFWRQRAQFVSHKGSGKGWLLAIVHNRAVDVWRREHKRAGHEALSDHPAGCAATEDIEEQVISRELAREMSELLRALPVEQQRVIEMAYFQGLTHSEIAATLGLPLGTVKGRTRLALDKLSATYPQEPQRVSSRT